MARIRIGSNMRKSLIFVKEILTRSDDHLTWDAMQSRPQSELDSVTHQELGGDHARMEAGGRRRQRGGHPEPNKSCRRDMTPGS